MTTLSKGIITHMKFYSNFIKQNILSWNKNKNSQSDYAEVTIVIFQVVHQMCQNFRTLKRLNAPVSLCRIYYWTRTNWPFMFGWGIIPGHSGNDNDNDNQFEQCSSHPCNFSRPARKFWTCSKILCTQRE